MCLVKYRNVFICLCLLLLTAGGLHAQEAKENIENAGTYLDSRTASLDQYIRKSNGIQQRLLKRLQRKERKLLKKLASKDSALYYDYIQQDLTYDSIARLSNDTAYHRGLAAKGNSTVDSLKGVQQFIAGQQGRLNAVSGLAGSKGLTAPKDLGNMQQQLNVQQNIDNLIGQKTKSLKSFADAKNIKGLKGIQKDVYYAGEKIKSWKELTDDPDEAEAKALEYLQGTEGFDKFLKQNNSAFGGLGNDATAADLQRMGYQTKASVNAMLQKSLGNNMPAVQQQMGQQVQQYTDRLSGVTKKVDEVKNSVKEVKQGVRDINNTKSNLANIEKPDFATNPEKGKPFRERLEWQYNFQTGRAGLDGVKPAMLDIGMSLGYKQNERLSFGLGLSSSLGLGRDWQHVKLSYEGIAARLYADWKWVYGFSFQAGYERAFRPANRAYLNENTDSPNHAAIEPSNNTFKSTFGGQQQTAYIGIMKRYKINSKWSGTFLAGYNFLWQQEGMRTPWLLRFGWGK